MHVMSILQLSALCARAMAVAGAVLSSTATAGTAATAHGGTAAAGAAAGPGLSSSSGKSFATKRTQAASAFVSSASRRGERPLRSSERTTAAARSRAISTADSSRGAGASQPRRPPRGATAPAFVLPLGSVSRPFCGGGGGGGQRSHRQGGGVSDLRHCGRSSRVRPSRHSSFGSSGASAVGADGCAAPGRKRPLSMNAAAAAVAAAEAMASAAAARVSSLPRPGSHGGGAVVDNLLSRSRPSLIGLRALAAGATAGGNEPDGGGGGRDGNKGGNGSGGGSGAGIVSKIGALQMLVSLVRWILTGGRAGLRQGQATAAATAGAGAEARRRESFQVFFFQLFQWMWWPFAALETGIVESSRGRRARGSGGRAYRRPKATGVPKQRAMLRPTLSAQQVQRAYARPQSTAYPRPKVSAKTLLELDVEDTVEALPPRKQRLALEAAGKDARASAVVSKDPLWSKFLVWFFEWAITSRAVMVEGLQVCVDARSNREAMSGLLQSVGITFNHLELENLQISGGARMNITGLDLKVMTLLWKRFGSFKKPFEVEGSYVLTSGDLASSAMVRRLVTNMMNSTLRKLEALATEPLRNSSITIKQVSAKKSRLVIEGEMAYDVAKVPFTYRTSIGVKGQGHVVYLKDAEVFWENVGGSLSLPLLPLETFDVDMGEGARIESIRIVNGQVALKARVVISPFPPLLVASLRKRAAFRFDVAERLSVAFGNLVQNMKILRLQFKPSQA
eukprot:g1845.t1